MALPLVLVPVLKIIGKKLGNAISDKITGSTGKTTSESDEQTAIRNDDWIKTLRDAIKDVNKKQPLSPKPTTKFKDRKPITDSDKPVDILPPLPPKFFPKVTDTKPENRKERVVPFSQQNGLDEMTWGGLIAYPIMKDAVGKPQKIQLIERVSTIDDREMEKNLEESARGFFNWIAINNGKFDRDKFVGNAIGNLYDQTALLFPEYLYSLSGELSWLFGTESVRDIYANFATSSNNVYCDGYTLRGVAYGDIAVTKSKNDLSNPSRNYKENKTLSMDDTVTEIFKNFTGEYDNTVSFVMENINHGAIAKAVGANDLKPSLVPVSLVNYTDDDLRKLRHFQIKGLEDELNSGGGDNATQKAIEKEITRLKSEPIKRYKEINNLDELIKWSTVAIHELLGDFPVKFEWHGSDIIQIGNKPTGKPEENNLPMVEWIDDKTKVTRNYSLAGMLRELIVSSELNYGMTGLNLRQGTSILMETGMTRQLLTKTHFLLDTIHDWCGIATKQVKKEVMFMFDPDVVDDYDKFLTPAPMDVMVDEIDTKVEKSTVSEAIHTIYEAAQITKSVNTVSMTQGSRDKWKRRIKGLRGVMSKNNPENGSFSTFTEDDDGNVKENTTSRPKGDFDDWCEAVESGFTTDAILKPWNGKFNERPRITDVTSTMLDKDG